jgi:hypothetical protein
VLKVIQGQHNKPKAAVHTAEMTSPLKKKKKMGEEWLKNKRNEIGKKETKT